MSASTTTPTTSGASATNLFPTTTASSTSVTSGGQNPTVYYFVFLGVLIVLLCVAACLAYRAYRIRRRYRNARQLAIARGEPFMVGREDYWGLGGFSGWTREGIDRLSTDRGVIEWEARRLGRRGKWERIPVLWESDVCVKQDQAEQLEASQPLTVHSLLPVDDSESLLNYDNPRSQVISARNMGPRPRPQPLFEFPSRSTILAWRRASTDPPRDEVPPIPAPGPTAPQGIEEGDMIRLAVVIRMPEEDGPPPDLDDDERSGWESGMELGVWEGEIGPAVEEVQSHGT